MTFSPTAPKKKSIWHKNTPVAYMGTLLNAIRDPAFVFDRMRGDVLLTNPAFLELSAYSAVEVQSRLLTDLFHRLPEELSAVVGEQSASIKRKNRTPLEVLVQLNEIDDMGQWGLVTVKSMQKKMHSASQVVLFNGLIELAQLAGKGDLQCSIEQAIQILHDGVGLEIVGVYQADSDFPQLRLLSAYDAALVLPEILPVTDLIRLSTSQIWYPGRRVSTELYRSGRIKGVSYLASTPLGQEGASMGLLVVGDHQANPIENLIQLISVVGSIVSMAVEQHILNAHQQQVIDEQSEVITLHSSLAEHIHEGMVLVAPDFSIQEINPVAEVMLGYSDKEARHEAVQSILIGSDRLLPALGDAFRGIPIHNLGQGVLQHRDGQAFPAKIETIPIEKDGKVGSVMILITDMSTDEQNRIRTQQLEQRAVIGEVIQVFAHEVRNPINNISLTLEAMGSEMPVDDPNQDFISRMQADCSRLSHLMESILASSKPLEPRFENLSLHMLLKKITERWRPRFAKVNVKLFSQLDPETPMIRGDPRSLEQVFANLITNAVDAMAKQGGGTLAVKVNAVNIIPNLPQVEVSITDNGPGIPDEIRDHLFEPFVSNNPRGTGLGLAITKQIVTAHRGSIKVNTFPGGTVFQVVLPAYIEGD